MIVSRRTFPNHDGTPETFVCEQIILFYISLKNLHNRKKEWN